MQILTLLIICKLFFDSDLYFWDISLLIKLLSMVPLCERSTICPVDGYMCGLFLFVCFLLRQTMSQWTYIVHKWELREFTLRSKIAELKGTDLFSVAWCVFSLKSKYTGSNGYLLVIDSNFIVPEKRICTTILDIYWNLFCDPVHYRQLTFYEWSDVYENWKYII